MARPPNESLKPPEIRRKSPYPVTEVTPVEPPPMAPLASMGQEWELEPKDQPEIPPYKPPGRRDAREPRTWPPVIHEKLADPVVNIVDNPLDALPSPLSVDLQAKRVRRNGKLQFNEISARKETSRRFLERLIDDPIYLETVADRMRNGTLAPPLETLFWQLVHGRPPDAEKVRKPKPMPVRIVHEFTTAAEAAAEHPEEPPVFVEHAHVGDEGDEEDDTARDGGDE